MSLNLTDNLTPKMNDALDILKKGGHITIVYNHVGSNELSISTDEGDIMAIHHKTIAALNKRNLLAWNTMCVTNYCDVDRGYLKKGIKIARK